MEPQTIVVFGGSSGIGEATAKLRSLAGDRVIIVGRDPARLEEARKRIGGRTVAERADATDHAALERLFDRIRSVDHLVLCHSGGRGAGAFPSLPLDDVRQGMEAKLFAQLSTAQAVLPRLAEAGSITFVSAASARAALPGTSGLAAINGAIEAMVPSLAKELAPRRINAVSPGIIDTPWWNAVPPEFKEACFQQATLSLPVRRVGRPEDVAKAISMIIDNGFMTGSILEVDGGAHLQ